MQGKFSKSMTTKEASVDNEALLLGSVISVTIQEFMVSVCNLGNDDSSIKSREFNIYTKQLYEMNNVRES